MQIVKCGGEVNKVCNICAAILQGPALIFNPIPGGRVIDDPPHHVFWSFILVVAKVQLIKFLIFQVAQISNFCRKRNYPS